MMARSTRGSNQRPDTLMQDRTSASMKVLLQRTAGPYIGVKMRRTRIEHILSALPPLATEERTFGNGSSVPRGDIRVAADSYYPRSGGLRPPWLAPARPEHRPAAASQRSLQAYSITSSVATQRALTISVKHDLWRAQCLNVTPTTHPAIGTSIRHAWTARQHGLLRRALSFREVANRSSPASPRRQKSSRWRGEPASYVRPPRLGQK
jgi:hypothetical protein